MRNVTVITGTRAEYGLLYWIMKGIKESEILDLQLIVTGAHLSHEFGSTYKQIEVDGFDIDKKVDMLISNDSPTAISKSIGLGIIGFAQVYEEIRPDILLVLGDRYEILAAVSASIPFNIPVAHIHGGEITEGAIDEQIRHAITKMSHLHFASTEKYAENIIKMGENKDRVFFVGAPGLEWVHYNQYAPEMELETELRIDFSKEVILATFHPVTTELENTEEYVHNIIEAVVRSGIQTIFTGANADPSGLLINKIIKDASCSYEQVHYIDNLGSQKYISCMKYSSLMLGNSSSGIIEAASFGLPVVNIGNRQKGRSQSKNVINVGYNADEIFEGIKLAISTEFKTQVNHANNIYGDGHVSKRIIDILENIDVRKLIPKRLTYDL